MAFFDDFCQLVALRVREDGVYLQSDYRLKENRDFRRVFRRGKSFATPRLVLYHCENRESSFRIGFSISKKVGNAVVRNRLKRQLRAAFQALIPELVDLRLDIVIVCRKECSDADYRQLHDDVVKLLHRAKIVI